MDLFAQVPRIARTERGKGIETSALDGAAGSGRWSRGGRRRPAWFAAMLALTLTLAFASSTTATQRTSSGGSVFGCDGGLCANATVAARWSVTLEHSEGTTYYTISKLWLWSVLPNSRHVAAVLGVSPMSGHYVQALNASGAVVRTIYLAQGSTCGQSYAVGSDDLAYEACTQLTDVPLSVTTLRLITAVQDPAVFGAGWNRSWNASLN